MKQDQLKECFEKVSNFDFNQDKFDAIKTAMNEHPLIVSDYYSKRTPIVSDTQLLEYFYANNLGINISHEGNSLFVFVVFKLTLFKGELGSFNL